MTQVTDFYAQMLESQRRAAEERVETRAALLSELRAIGVTSIEVRYEGYGDSGNVEDVVVTPGTIILTDELRRQVEDFGWDFAYGYVIERDGEEVDACWGFVGDYELGCLPEARQAVPVRSPGQIPQSAAAQAQAHP